MIKGGKMPHRHPKKVDKRWTKPKFHHLNGGIELENSLYFHWSGRSDSNTRPPAPKAGALTRLRYAPTFKRKARL